MKIHWNQGFIALFAAIVAQALLSAWAVRKWAGRQTVPKSADELLDSDSKVAEMPPRGKERYEHKGNPDD